MEIVEGDAGCKLGVDHEEGGPRDEGVALAAGASGAVAAAVGGAAAAAAIAAAAEEPREVPGGGSHREEGFVGSCQEEVGSGLIGAWTSVGAEELSEDQECFDPCSKWQSKLTKSQVEGSERRPLGGVASRELQATTRLELSRPRQRLAPSPLQLPSLPFRYVPSPPSPHAPSSPPLPELFVPRPPSPSSPAVPSRRSTSLL